MVQISALWLVVVAGLVSTLASFLGGYLMYTEGLRVLEKTVEEVGRADAQAMNREATRIFKVTDDYQKKYRDILLRYNDFRNRDDFANWVVQHALADLVNGDVLESIVMRGIHKTDPLKHYVEYLWVDPLADGSKEYIYSRLHPDIDDELCPAPCLIAHSMDPITGKPIANVYNYSNNDFPKLYLDSITTNNLTAGDSWWSSPILWYSKDFTPYVYIEHPMLMPPIESGVFEDMIVFVGTDLATYPFESFMLEYNTDASMVLTQLDKGFDSFILSANFIEGRVDRSCRYEQLVVDSGSQPCIKTLRNLTTEQREIVLSMANTTDWKFDRHDDFWTLRSQVFKPGKFDRLAPVYLMWFRSVSKVKGEMNRALYLFIGFLMGVIVFDLLIGFAEIILIARPMIRLSEATYPLQSMNLDEASELIDVGSDRIIQISELEKLRVGLAFAVKSLKEYKSFLPRTLFADDEDTREESDSTSVSRTSKLTSSQIYTTRDILCLGLSTARYAGVLVGLPESDSGASSVPSSSIFQLLEETSKLTRGQLHGFSAVNYETFLVTWTGVHRNEMALRFCNDLQRSQIKTSRAMASSSKWITGNAGTNTYRGFFMEGMATENLLKSFAYSNYAASLGQYTTIIATDVAKTVASLCTCVPVGFVSHKGRNTFQVEIVGTEKDMVEWMYDYNAQEETSLIEMLSEDAFVLDNFKAETSLQKKLAEIAKTAIKNPSTVFSVEFVPSRFTPHQSDE